MLPFGHKRNRGIGPERPPDAGRIWEGFAGVDRLVRSVGPPRLVTGSSQGIGLSLALGLGRAGAAIVLNGRDAAKLDGAVAELRNEGITAQAAAFDVSDAVAVKVGVDRIEAEIGALDILVNNAGIQRRAPLEDYPVETWHELMRVNLDSVFYVGQAVARHMITRKRGKIINIASLQSEAARYSIAPTPPRRAR